jgi:hypothetical protein
MQAWKARTLVTQRFHMKIDETRIFQVYSSKSGLSCAYLPIEIVFTMGVIELQQIIGRHVFTSERNFLTMPALASPTAKPSHPWWSGAGFCALSADTLASVELQPSLQRMAQLGASAIWLQTAPEDEMPGNLQSVIALAHALGLKVIVELALLTPHTACPEALRVALQQALHWKVDAVSLQTCTNPATRALAPALHTQMGAPPGFALLGAPGDLHAATDTGEPKNKIRWLSTVDVQTTTLADLQAPVLHSQIRHALRTAGPAAIVWNTTAPCPRSRPAVPHPDSATPAQARYIAPALFSCLKGAFRMDIHTVGAGCSAQDRFMQFLQWQSEITVFQHGKLKLLPSHKHLLAFTRTQGSTCVLCVFNLSDRYVRHNLPAACQDASVLAGSGFQGGRIVDGYLDLDPWGAIFARF